MADRHRLQGRPRRSRATPPERGSGRRAMSGCVVARVSDRSSEWESDA
jgi:hypothetical protein